jgi:hypothetical protein
MNPTDLERDVDRRLRQLPSPRAPRTLRPRVMAAVRVARQSARATGWFEWSPMWQSASIAALVLLVGGFVTMWPIVQALFEAYVSVPAAAALVRTGDRFRGVADVATAAFVIWRVIVHPIVVYALIFVGAMCVACAAFGSALSRVALGGASHS